MGEYVNDLTEQADIDTGSGNAIKYMIGIGGHATLTPAQRVTLRDAALIGWSDLRAAWVALDARAGAWLDALPAAQQSQMVRLLKRAPVPPT